MKKIFFYGLVLLIGTSCTKSGGRLMPTSNNIKIEETDTKDSIIVKAAHVVPTPNQYSALKNEFIAFIHFGPNTFTRMEWGSGKEDPAIFKLQNLDTDQWCEAMIAAGMKMVVFTAKHHDGFCLWQTRYTKHGVMSSPFRNGKGDVLKDLSESCRKYGLKLGVYLSPADLFQIENKEGLYGNLSIYTERVIPRPVEGRPFGNKTTFKFKVDDYNEYFLNQLFELLTEYGPVHEVWFDGAHPKRKGGQKYNYVAWKTLIRELAPEAVIFGRQDLRWCGNEAGRTRETEWNIIPYQENPDSMGRFADLTNEHIGQREQLFEGKYLFYQPAETNTSIREGWFYRNDTKQKTRSTDDVFDMYERSVGGNSILLLNIPPNREGTFSPADVKVLEETGERINETYGNNLLAGAKGPKNILDNDDTTFELLLNTEREMIVETPQAIKTNRFVIQEAIATHSERIEKHVLDAWIDNKWIEIATATNVGYKRILRFPGVSSNKFRIRVLESRLIPAISSVSAHFYKTRPPQLVITRDVNGKVLIQPKKHKFGWKSHGEDAGANLQGNTEIRYTIDGSEPVKESTLYSGPFQFMNGEIKARVIDGSALGPISEKKLGIERSQWKAKASSFTDKFAAPNALDGKEYSLWQSKTNAPMPQYLSIDLGKTYSVSGFTYLPRQGTNNPEGMIEKAYIEVSKDGKNWKIVQDVKFGNIRNDPSLREVIFDQPVEAKYFKITATAGPLGSKNVGIAEIEVLSR